MFQNKHQVSLDEKAITAQADFRKLLIARLASAPAGTDGCTSPEDVADHILAEPAIKTAFQRCTPRKPLAFTLAYERITILGARHKGDTIYKCPQCTCFIREVCDFCLDCGQALDWS